MSDFDRIWGFLSPATQKRILEQEKQADIKRADSMTVTPWAEVTKFVKWLLLDPHDFLSHEDHLCHLRPSFSKAGRQIKLSEHLVLRWNRVEAKRFIPIAVGTREGKVAFTRDLVMPVLIRTKFGGEVVMSITPMECMTQRRGIRYCKGHVVLGGLGLGWSLIKIAQRDQVKKITVIEKDKDVLRVMRPKLSLPAGTTYEWVHGDMYKEAPKLEADVLFADIWNSYGDRKYDRERLIKACPNIKRVWCWARWGSG